MLGLRALFRCILSVENRCIGHTGLLHRSGNLHDRFWARIDTSDAALVTETGTGWRNWVLLAVVDELCLVQHWMSGAPWICWAWWGWFALLRWWGHGYGIGSLIYVAIGFCNFGFGQGTDGSRRMCYLSWSLAHFGLSILLYGCSSCGRQWELRYSNEIFHFPYCCSAFIGVHESCPCTTWLFLYILQNLYTFHGFE